MKKRIYIQPETTISDMVSESAFATYLSKAKGRGDRLSIGYGEDEEDEVDPTANHNKVWDSLDY